MLFHQYFTSIHLNSTKCWYILVIWGLFRPRHQNSSNYCCFQWYFEVGIPEKCGNSPECITFHEISCNLANFSIVPLNSKILAKITEMAPRGGSRPPEALYFVRFMKGFRRAPQEAHTGIGKYVKYHFMILREFT